MVLVPLPAPIASRPCNVVPLSVVSPIPLLFPFSRFCHKRIPIKSNSIPMIFATVDHKNPCTVHVYVFMVRAWHYILPSMWRWLWWVYFPFQQLPGRYLSLIIWCSSYKEVTTILITHKNTHTDTFWRDGTNTIPVNVYTWPERGVQAVLVSQTLTT